MRGKWSDYDLSSMCAGELLAVLNRAPKQAEINISFELIIRIIDIFLSSNKNGKKKQRLNLSFDLVGWQCKMCLQ